MPYLTDERLKSFLDTNQLHREQMCRSILALDNRFSDVCPRHPRGGRDGGRDMEAVFQGAERAFGAVGFVNQANDSRDQKSATKKKFADDLKAALTADPKPSVFVFLTNVALTAGEKGDLVASAKSAGMTFCDIFDRERMRIALDSTDGFALRFQYLSIPLSEAEQASFFAKWGGDIQALISTGFQRIEGTLQRIMFLQEASDILSAFSLRFDLDRPYNGDEIGHFRAFVLLHLVEAKVGFHMVVFGSSDKSMRMRSDATNEQEPAGIKHGISAGAWEQRVRNADGSPIPGLSKNGKERYTQAGGSSSVGMDPVSSVWAQYTHDRGFLRFEPRLSVRDLDGAFFLPMLNRSLAEKVKAIHIYANGYKLDVVQSADCYVDSSAFDSSVPVRFSKKELADPWVRLRPKRASTFSISFSEKTPKRFYAPREILEGVSTLVQSTKR